MAILCPGLGCLFGDDVGGVVGADVGGDGGMAGRDGVVALDRSQKHQHLVW